VTTDYLDVTSPYQFLQGDAKNKPNGYYVSKRYHNMVHIVASQLLSMKPVFSTVYTLRAARSRSSHRLRYGHPTRTAVPVSQS